MYAGYRIPGLGLVLSDAPTYTLTGGGAAWRSPALPPDPVAGFIGFLSPMKALRSRPMIQLMGAALLTD